MSIACFPLRTALSRRLQITALMLFCGLANVSNAQTQDHPYHQPLNQHSPPGKTAAWLNYLRKYDPAWLQPMRVDVEGGGNVEVYSGSPVSIGGHSSPAIVAANAGHLYRLRISGMQRFPGIDIYPTVELIDRMHPPQGREDEFPIPIIITEADMKIALTGQLVTRVIYLEQPQVAAGYDPLDSDIPQSVPPAENALQEADRLGRPMAIIRLGGRRPTAASSAAFFGTGGAARIRSAPEHTRPPSPTEAGLPSAILRTSATRPDTSIR